MLLGRIGIVLAFVVGLVGAAPPGPLSPFDPPEYFSPPFKTAMAQLPPHAFQSPLDFDMTRLKPNWLDYIQQQKTGIRAIHLGKYPQFSNPIVPYPIKKPMVVFRILSPDATSAHRPQHRIWAQFISSDMPCGWKGDLFNNVMSFANSILPPKCQLPIPTPHPLRVKYYNLVFDDLDIQMSPTSMQYRRRMRAMHRMGDYLPSFEMTSREPSPFAARQLPSIVRQDRLKVLIPVTPAHPDLEEANQWCHLDLRVECYTFQLHTPASGSDIFVILENQEPHIQLVEAKSFWIELEPQPTSLIVSLPWYQHQRQPPGEGPSNRDGVHIAPLQASPADSQAITSPIGVDETLEINDDDEPLEQRRGLRRTSNFRDLSVENLEANSERVRKKSPRRSPRKSKSLPPASPWAPLIRQDYCPGDIRRLSLVPKCDPRTPLQSSTSDAVDSGDSAITLKRWHQDVRGRENPMPGVHPSLLERVSGAVASAARREQASQTEEDERNDPRYDPAVGYSRWVASSSDHRQPEMSSDDDRGQQSSLRDPHDPSSPTAVGERKQTEEVIDGREHSQQSSLIAHDLPLPAVGTSFSPSTSSTEHIQDEELKLDQDHGRISTLHLPHTDVGISDPSTFSSEGERKQTEGFDAMLGHSSVGLEETPHLPSSSQNLPEQPIGG